MPILPPSVNLPTPSRVSLSDDPIDILEFAISAFDRGRVALATLVEIRGGAARALGSHVAIAADGRFCGYVSGGCVEAAVASEALQAMAQGCDRSVVYGEGSPFFDIVLPCGGGITVAIHVLREVCALKQVIEQVRDRHSAGLEYRPHEQKLVAADAVVRSGWIGTGFRSVYRPRTRVVISGQSAEAQAVARLAEASGYDVIAIGPAIRIITDTDIDTFTAVALLHHDLEAEAPLLETALSSRAFYIGALGSTRTHRTRINRLVQAGFSPAACARIKAPIGLFGPTRDAQSLALSVLADVAAARLATYG